MKPNTAKRERLLGGVQHDTQTTQRRERIGHQPFAAGLVDRRTRGISHRYVESLQTRCDSRRQSGRSTAYDENVSVFRKCSQSETTTLIKRVRNRNRDPSRPADRKSPPPDAASS